MLRGKPFILLVLAGFGLGPSPIGADTDPARDDEQTLRAAGVGVDGPALLEFFRKRTPTQVDQEKLATLIRQLGDDRFGARQKASAELTILGNLAAPLLRQALKNQDPEVVHRAERILKAIEAGPNISLLAAASRLVALRKPPGAAEVLLAYLPFADDRLEEEVRLALAAVAVSNGKPEPVLVKALGEKTPLKRGAAGEALCRAGIAEIQAEVRPLLKDRDPGVRLRVGLAFFARRDKEVIPVLIALLSELPANQVWQVEEILYQLAGDRAPNLSVGADTAPAKVRQAWTDWWRTHGAQVDLTKLDQVQPPLGYTVVVEKDTRHGTNGRVVELGRDGKPRWQIEMLLYPVDVQVLGPDRVLVAENNGNRVTERDLKGKVLWEKQIALPVSCQRLRNGNTFIATSSQLVEVDRTGKEVFTYPQGKNPIRSKIIAGKKLRNGQVIFVTSPGTLTRLDSTGKILGSFPVGKVSYFASTLHALPNGRILVPAYIDNKVVEYDLTGKAVWEVTVQHPVSAYRLANGNTLVASPPRRVVVELNRNGKEVWQVQRDGQPRQARRR